MLRLQPVFKMDLLTAQLTPLEVDLALFWKKEELAQRTLGKDLHCGTESEEENQSVLENIYIYFQRDHPRTKCPLGTPHCMEGRGSLQFLERPKKKQQKSNGPKDSN